MQRRNIMLWGIGTLVVLAVFGIIGYFHVPTPNQKALVASVSDAIAAPTPEPTPEPSVERIEKPAPVMIVSQPETLSQREQEINDLIQRIEELKKQLAEVEAAEAPAIIDNIKSSTPESKHEDIKPLIQTPNQAASTQPENHVDEEIEVYPQIYISEIQIGTAADAKQEFVELYNPNSNDIDLTDWYMQRKTATAASPSSFISSTLFKGKTISAQGYFLIGRKGYFSGLADLEISSSLTENNTLFLKDPDQEVIDKVGWGTANDFIAAPAINPGQNTTIGRKFELGQEDDFGNNSADFPLNVPTPRAQNIIYRESVLAGEMSITEVVPFESAPEPSAQQVAPANDISDSTNQPQELQTQQNPPIENPTSPTTQPPLIINEIAWMGDTASANHEWIELYNPGSQSVDLSGWRLAATDGSPSINLSGLIVSHGFFLLERTDDNSASGVSADQIYTGALGNSGEHLILYDSVGKTQNEIDCASGWVAGDNTTKQTMQRTENGGWHNSENPGGTPKS
jgi:hypothetical protein